MTSSDPAMPRPRSRIEAIAIMCFASLCFIAMHTFIKSVRGEVPIAVILWSQYAFQFILLSALFAPRVVRMVTSPMMGLQVLRGLMLTITICAMFVAVGLMQLADAIAIAFVAPLLITALSVITLKEKVTRGHWVAIVVGFGGVLVIIQPGSGLFNWTALVPLGAAVSVAIYQTMTRPISQSVGPTTILYNATWVGLIASSVAVPFFWIYPSTEAVLFLMAAACLGAMAHFCLIKAYQWAPASVVAPFAYIELIYASALGFAVFGDIPDLPTIFGGMIIAASGLYLIRRSNA
ncbi:MAG: DMT family transporter [Alphaproteobacteria bacterium]|nr:DMT family transporter [Alphaproteobacteria bacterium]